MTWIRWLLCHGMVTHIWTDRKTCTTVLMPHVIYDVYHVLWWICYKTFLSAEPISTKLWKLLLKKICLGLLVYLILCFLHTPYNIALCIYYCTILAWNCVVPQLILKHIALHCGRCTALAVWQTGSGQVAWPLTPSTATVARTPVTTVLSMRWKITRTNILPIKSP